MNNDDINLSALEPSGEGVGAEPVAWNGLDHSWQTLLERDDLTSPEDYPDHALITKDELRDIVASATSDVFALYAQPLSGMEGVETQDTIGQWADEVFGKVTSLPRTVERAGEELRELADEAAGGADPDLMIVEAADVVIVLKRLAAVIGRDLDAAVNAKMARNRARQWRSDGTGHGYHTKEAPSLSTPVSAASPEGEAAVPEGFVLMPVEPTEAMIKGLAYELCSQRGLHPNKVDRGGVELWETFKPIAKLTLAEVVRLVTVARQGTDQTQEKNRG